MMDIDNNNNNVCMVFCCQGIRTIKVNANGYYTAVKSVNVQSNHPVTVMFKLIKDERVLNMPRMMFIVLTGRRQIKYI